MRTARATAMQLWLPGQYQDLCGINRNTSGMEFYGTEDDVSREEDGCKSRPIDIAPAVEDGIGLIFDE